MLPRAKNYYYYYYFVFHTDSLLDIVRFFGIFVAPISVVLLVFCSFFLQHVCF